MSLNTIAGISSSVVSDSVGWEKTSTGSEDMREMNVSYFTVWFSLVTAGNLQWSGKLLKLSGNSESFFRAKSEK